MSEGSLGSHTHPGFVDEGTAALTHNRPPGALAGPTATQVEQNAIQAARRLSTALNGLDANAAIVAFLGGDSFTAGVVFGMGQNLAVSAVELVKLFKMLALAEYYESQHAQSFWEKFRATMFGSLSAVHGSLVIASMFWPDFDHQAQVAYDERQALFKTVKQAFENPGEVFAHISVEQKKKYQDFKQSLESHSISGNFHAGVLFGELLLDVLLIVDGLTAIARVATKVPELLKLLPKLEELAPVLRRPPKISGIVKEAAGGRGVRPVGGRVYDAINPTGRARTASERPQAPRAAPTTIDAGTLSQAKIDEIVSMEKGSRPSPDTYLSQAYRDAHAQLFSGGAARIQPSVPTGTIGKTETWVLPKSVTQDAIARSGGDVSKLEELLGLDKGYLGDNPVLVSIPEPTGYRIPSGKEFGANNFWRPGGFTSPGGLPEALIDPVKPGSYTVSPIFPK